MLRGCFKICTLAGCTISAVLAARAQGVVHALTVTVIAINPIAKTIQIKTDNGSEGLFKDSTNSNISLEFDKDIRSGASAADAFTKKGAHVILYYFGNGDVRTAVEAQRLSDGPFENAKGTVVNFEKHPHLPTIRSDGGGSVSFQVGAERLPRRPWEQWGYKFDPERQQRVRVTAFSGNGDEIALLIDASQIDGEIGPDGRGGAVFKPWC